MGARVVGEGLALDIVDTFLETEFSNDERHIRRINMIGDQKRKSKLYKNKI